MTVAVRRIDDDRLVWHGTERAKADAVLRELVLLAGDPDVRRRYVIETRHDN